MKHTILFLAANPLGTDRLALDREARAIQVELERSGFRDSFELVTRWAVEPLDLLRELRKLKPTVVHFSGHGSRGHGSHGGDRARDPAAGPYRDIVVAGAAEPGVVDGGLDDGLLFQGVDGEPRRVSAAALQDAFAAAGSSVKLVVLSACYSEPQAAALLSRVDCVVGMRGSIGDDAAWSFAIGFYGGLGDRESVAAAYKQGCAAIRLQGLHDADLPQLQVRPGVDAERLILASASPQADAHQDKADGTATAPPGAGETSVTRDELLTRLSRLLPAQFEVVLFLARVPMEHLSGAGAPQVTRAIEVIRYLEMQGRLPQLAATVQEVAAGPRQPREREEREVNRVFISYRTSDCPDLVGRLDGDLARALGRDAVFLDQTRLYGGQEWPAELEANARSCPIMLAMIGPGWQTAAFSDGDRRGFPRLSDSRDWVRREIELSFDSGNVVIPVYMNGAEPPSENWLLSCGLGRLFGRQGVRLNNDDYGSHLARLLAVIRAHGQVSSMPE